MEHENLRDLKTTNPGSSWALYPLGGTVDGGIQGCSQGGKDFRPLLSMIWFLLYASELFTVDPKDCQWLKRIQSTIGNNKRLLDPTEF